MSVLKEKFDRISNKLINNNYSSLLIFLFCLVAIAVAMFLFFIVAGIIGAVFYGTNYDAVKSFLDGPIASFIGILPMLASIFALLVSLVGVIIALMQIKSHQAKIVPIIGLLLNSLNVSLFFSIIIP
ncbi:hypothetical protein CIB95_09315 [Lottiidibacillus patelloidae]|uniref:Yip1 domain-containing protein n=1 Tax=Lottiidibacillus patelloidae TaxID=2670334 RepID=A0A263BTD2_9BACI|nr:hypothetical protein [Lottiidibacillus patelloidae]OZM56959.1 hypothetical protein CIB95_09315 [Lottiidibacillus patelloidae]